MSDVDPMDLNEFQAFSDEEVDALQRFYDQKLANRSSKQRLDDILDEIRLRKQLEEYDDKRAYT